jgi:carboxylesterase type B
MRVLLLGLFFALPAALHSAQFPQTVKIDTGLVSGVPSQDSAVVSFKGIPFAAPPVGDLRWKPPVPPAPWTGVLRADHYGASCVQPLLPDESSAGKSPYSAEFFVRGQLSEDCLYLNIWTPAHSAGQHLPVMVYFYGGGFFQGSASEPIYDAEGLAHKGVVVVTLNYRLGLLGFLASQEIDAQSPQHVSGNYGTLDQIEALRWVARNIAAFGGNPKLVTIFGQSAGGGSVHFLSLSPLARGLFVRAIVQSATMYPNDPLFLRGATFYRKLGDAEKAYGDYLQKAGIHSIAQLRSMTTQQIMDMPPAPFPPAFFSPLVDGYVIPQTFRDSYTHHRQADVTYVVGGNAEDLGVKPSITTTLTAYRQWAQEKFGPLTTQFLALYPASDDNEASHQESLAIHDQNLISKILWAREASAGTTHAIYLYYWTHALPGPFASKFGAFHTSDVPYVMGSLDELNRPYTPQDRQISAELGQYWANFARTGNPNGQGLPVWPEFRTSGLTLEIGDVTKPFFAGASQDKVDFFKKYFDTFPAM